MIKKFVFVFFSFLLFVAVVEIDAHGRRKSGNRKYGEERERSSSDDTCQLEPEVGECRAARERWFYNSTSKACETFLWGGCGGNENRFETKTACEAKCKGGNFHSRWWYSGRSHSVSCAVTKPKCSNECAFGRANDARGCPTCTCSTRRSYRRPSQLPGESSTCDDEPSVQCTLYCEHGFKKDVKGCTLCECSEAPSARYNKSRSSSCDDPSVQCTLYCEHGFKKDEKGCQICQCSDAPVASQLPAASAASVAKSNCPRPKCKYDCTFGYQTNSYGCPTCACRPRSRSYSRRRSCSDISATCRMTCENGFAKDENGCDVCSCAAVKRVDLKPSSDDCPSQAMCRLHCPDGEFKKAPDGCDTCACADGW